MNTALITGASRGIGRAAAMLLAARGWCIGINYVSNEQAASETVAAILQAGGNACAIRADVANESEVTNMFDVVTATFGPIHAFVNNGGGRGHRLAAE